MEGLPVLGSFRKRSFQKSEVGVTGDNLFQSCETVQKIFLLNSKLSVLVNVGFGSKHIPSFSYNIVKRFQQELAIANQRSRLFILIKYAYISREKYILNQFSAPLESSPITNLTKSQFSPPSPPNVCNDLSVLFTD